MHTIYNFTDDQLLCNQANLELFITELRDLNAINCDYIINNNKDYNFAALILDAALRQFYD